MWNTLLSGDRVSVAIVIYTVHLLAVQSVLFMHLCVSTMSLTSWSIHVLVNKKPILNGIIYILQNEKAIICIILRKIWKPEMLPGGKLNSFHNSVTAPYITVHIPKKYCIDGCRASLPWLSFSSIIPFYIKKPMKNWVNE